MMMDELASYKVDVSHQELSRVIKELEDLSDTCPTVTWIAIEAAANWLCQQLGYEDYGELEDALHCTLEEFLRQLPHFDVKNPEPGAEDQCVRYRSNLRDSATGRPCKISFRVENRGDLWVVMLKPKGSWIEIPEIAFEIGRSDARQVDTIYNYLGEAVYNLGSYLRTNHGAISQDRFDGIYATIHQLNGLLDVDEPFTWVIHDPTGTAAFKPNHTDKMKIEFLDA
jgi:C4-type Zn-finger protein